MTYHCLCRRRLAYIIYIRYLFVEMFLFGYNADSSFLYMFQYPAFMAEAATGAHYHMVGTQLCLWLLYPA